MSGDEPIDPAPMDPQLLEIWDECAAARAAGVPVPSDTVIRLYRMLAPDSREALESRAVLHVSAIYGNETAEEILEALSDDPWWAMKPGFMDFLPRRSPGD